MHKFTVSLGNKERHNLLSMIGYDLICFGKLPLCLIICIIITAIAVITITHQTRLLIAQNDHLILENNALDVEWRNLILEENSLIERSRIERIAIEKLHLQHINNSQENIILKNEDKCD